MRHVFGTERKSNLFTLFSSHTHCQTRPGKHHQIAFLILLPPSHFLVSSTKNGKFAFGGLVKESGSGVEWGSKVKRKQNRDSFILSEYCCMSKARPRAKVRISLHSSHYLTQCSHYILFFFSFHFHFKGKV